MIKRRDSNHTSRTAIPGRDNELIIVGIDPGSRITGYGVVRKRRGSIRHIAHGEIRIGRNESLSDCLQKIFDVLYEIIEVHTPDAVSLEDIFYGKNIKSLIKLGHVRGVAILAASKHHVPIFEYTPLEVKKAVVGYGRAEKSQIQTMVKAILKLKEVPSVDASDALAIAICHAHFMKVDPV